MKLKHLKKVIVITAGLVWSGRKDRQEGRLLIQQPDDLKAPIAYADGQQYVHLDYELKSGPPVTLQELCSSHVSISKFAAHMGQMDIQIAREIIWPH